MMREIDKMMGEMSAVSLYLDMAEKLSGEGKYKEALRNLDKASAILSQNDRSLHWVDMGIERSLNIILDIPEVYW